MRTESKLSILIYVIMPTKVACLIYVFFIIGILEPLYANSEMISTEAIPHHLEFRYDENHEDLLLATDEQGDTWVKGHIPVDLLDASMVLQIPTIHISDYDLYIHRGEQLVAVPKDINPNNRVVRNRYPTYYFTTDHTTYYLNIKKQPINSLHVVVSETGEFVQQESVSLMRNSLYYGLSIMCIIFNIVLFFIFRDRRFVIYSLLQLSLFFIFLYQDGLWYYYSQGRWEIPHFLLWNIALCATLSGIFTYYFLDLKRKIPYFKKIALPLIAAIFGSVLVYTYTDMQFFRSLASFFFYLFPAICFYQAIKMFREDVYARFLVLFFGLMLAVGIVYTLQRYIDSPFLAFFDINVFRLTSVMEIIGISFALIFKVRALREENERYRTDLQHYLHILKLNATSAQKETSIITLPLLLPTEQSTHVNQLTDDIAVQYDLTEREKEVLRCIWNGDSNQEIANRLCISVNTVKFHVSRLYSKLDVKNRSEVRSMKDHVTRYLRKVTAE